MHNKKSRCGKSTAANYYIETQVRFRVAYFFRAALCAS